MKTIKKINNNIAIVVDGENNGSYCICLKELDMEIFPMK